jgi:PAS domain S-box-containing protein
MAFAPNLVLLSASAAVGIAGLAGTYLVARDITERERVRWAGRAASEAGHVAVQLDAGLNRTANTLERIGVWWLSQGRPLAPEDWQQDAALFLNDTPGMQEVIWVNPSGWQVWSAKPGTPQNVEGVRRPRPDMAQLISNARQRKAAAFLAKAGAGAHPMLHVCAPVLWKGSTGHVIGVFDSEVLIDKLLQHQLPRDFHVTLRDGQRKLVLFQSGPPPRAGGVTGSSVIQLPDATWNLELHAPGDVVDGAVDLLRVFGATESVLLAVCLAFVLLVRRRSRSLDRANREIRDLNRDLRRRLEEFRILLEVIPVGIAVTDDPECRRISMNPSLARMMGVSLEKNISQSTPEGGNVGLRFTRHGQPVPAEDLPMQKAARTGHEVLGDELTITRPDGVVIETLSYSAPLFDEAGHVRGVLNACVDVTERKRAEQERRAMREREERRERRDEKLKSLLLMAGGTVHEFNNLLTGIMASVSLAAHDVPPDSEPHKQLTTALAFSDRAARLTAKLLAFTGRAVYRPASLDVSNVISGIESSLQSSISITTDLRLELANGLPPVKAALAGLQDAIRQLVANAEEAAPETGGIIQVGTCVRELGAQEIGAHFADQGLAPGTYVCISVEDNGGGIPDDILPKVFDPFFTTKFTGRGLGLAAVQGFVRAHGGGVRAEKSSLGGARVRIVFPAYKAGAASQ